MNCDPTTCRQVHYWEQHLKEETCINKYGCDTFLFDDDDVAAHMITHHGEISEQKCSPQPKSEIPKPSETTKPRKQQEAPKRRAKEYGSRQNSKQFSSSRPSAPIPMDAEVVPFLDPQNGCKWVVHQALRTVTSDGQVRYLIGVCGRKKADAVKFCPDCNKVRLARYEQRNAAKPSHQTEPYKGDSEQEDGHETD
ncbi:hypothetical protein PV-S19_0288 [Pacmanvirus S19]|nr:hypothetical protein PV-S19_0288 [Pacmanvirus S19]